MAAAAANPSTFPLFSSLPPELRNQIWLDALPDNIGPALYFYKKGCWSPRRLSKHEEGYDHKNDEYNLNFEFRHDLLDEVLFELPLLFINREARDITITWIRRQGIQIRSHDDREYPVFVHPFDLRRDALYIAVDKWNDFLCEPGDRQFQPDLLEQIVDLKPNLTRIAVTEALLRSEAASLPDMFEYFFQLEVLFIIVDAQPDLLSRDNDTRVQQRWEVESTRGRAFCWNDERGSFDVDGGKYIGDENLYRLIGEANKGLGKGLVKNHKHSFEIRPVFAVRR